MAVSSYNSLPVDVMVQHNVAPDSSTGACGTIFSSALHNCCYAELAAEFECAFTPCALLYFVGEARSPFDCNMPHDSASRAAKTS
jgi:hypothetical protein